MGVNIENVSFNPSPRLGPSLDEGLILNVTVSSNQNNFNPTGFQTGGVINISHMFINATSDFDLKGILAPNPKIYSVLTIINIGDKKIKCKKNSGGSLAANRFNFKGDIDIEKKEGLTLVYHPASERWYRETTKD